MVAMGIGAALVGVISVVALTVLKGGEEEQAPPPKGKKR